MKTDDISKLELLLVQKEIPVLQAEIQRGMGIVFAAFDKYRKNEESSIRLEPDQIKELNLYIRKVSPLSSSYYGGYHLREKAASDIANGHSIPDCLRNLILDYVVPVFVERMNAVESEAAEIRNIAEQAAHYAQEG